MSGTRGTHHHPLTRRFLDPVPWMDGLDGIGATWNLNWQGSRSDHPYPDGEHILYVAFNDFNVLLIWLTFRSYHSWYTYIMLFEIVLKGTILLNSNKLNLYTAYPYKNNVIIQILGMMTDSWWINLQPFLYIWLSGLFWTWTGSTVWFGWIFGRDPNAGIAASSGMGWWSQVDQTGREGNWGLNHRKSQSRKRCSTYLELINLSFMLFPPKSNWQTVCSEITTTPVYCFKHSKLHYNPLSPVHFVCNIHVGKLRPCYHVTLPGPWHPWQGQHRTITQVFNSAPSASESFVSTELRQRLIPLYLSTPQDMGMDGICVQYHRVYMFVRGQIPECSLNGSYLMTQVFNPRNCYSPNQKSKEIRSCQATLHTLLVLLMIISNFIHWFIHSLSMSSLVCLGNISGF